VNDPLYPFGYGLSYTHFTYSDITLSDKKISADGKLLASVKVSNIGDVDGRETVQLYIRDLVGSITRPVKELKAFKQIDLKKGESKIVEFELTAKDLAFYNRDLHFVAEAGDFKLFVGGDSVSVKEADFSLVEDVSF
jgi:beta-glucosidase